MIGPRLLTVASFVNKNAIVLDVGTDHAYLPIYLEKNNLCQRIIASDISIKALESAKKNITKYQSKRIKLVLSDGLRNIEDKYDTLILSGMGTHTIINILEGHDLPQNIIICSNNDLYLLRHFMNKKGYKIKYEKAIIDNNKYYDIISFIQGKEHLSKKILKYGKSNNKDYYNYLYIKQKGIIKKLKFWKKLKKIPDLVLLRIMSI